MTARVSVAENRFLAISFEAHIFLTQRRYSFFWFFHHVMVLDSIYVCGGLGLDYFHHFTTWQLNAFYSGRFPSSHHHRSIFWASKYLWRKSAQTRRGCSVLPQLLWIDSGRSKIGNCSFLSSHWARYLLLLKDYFSIFNFPFYLFYFHIC